MDGIPIPANPSRPTATVSETADSPNGRRPTAKQARFVAAVIVRTNTFAGAAKAAGYCHWSVRKASVEIATTQGVRELFTEALDDAGATPARVAAVLRQGLEAEHVRFLVVDGKIEERRSPDYG